MFLVCLSMSICDKNTTLFTMEGCCYACWVFGKCRNVRMNTKNGKLELVVNKI